MPEQDAIVKYGDARNLGIVPDASIDLVVTSPPYLNAIDYLRGHKLSLVWFGYTVEQIRNIRAESIGSERAAVDLADDVTSQIESAMVSLAKLPTRHQRMISRYARDVYRMVGEIKRVLIGSGKAVLVVGDSCLRSEFISNSDGIKEAADLHGLRLVSQAIRELAQTSRYLPMSKGTALGKRMHMENVLTFAHA
jgi:hypothetical protein